MSYKVYNEKEIKELDLIPSGTKVELVVAEKVTLGQNEHRTEATVSNNGNEMIKVVNEIYNEEGNKITTILDFIVPGSRYGDKKLFQFCKSLNIIDAYAKSDLNAVVNAAIGKSGYATISIQKGEDEYPDRNSIGMYVSGAATSKELQKAKDVEEELDDDIPF